MGENGSHSMRFQYSLIINISLIDWYLTSMFGIVDRYEWKQQGLLTGFLKKILVWTNGSFWAQKWHILTALDWLYEFFLKFCIKKG